MTPRHASKADRPELDAAPCRICGVMVPEHTGDRLHAKYAVPSHWRDVEAEDGSVWQRAVPAGNPWLRQHTRCRSNVGWILSQVVGSRVTDDEAKRLLEYTDKLPAAFQQAQAEGLMLDWRKGWAKPFDWFTAGDRRELRAALDPVRREIAAAPDGRMRRCTSGACGVCGAAWSSGWKSGPVTWSDGTKAPLCADCAVLWRATPTDQGVDGLRVRAEAALAGMRPQLGDDSLGLRLYADLAGDDHAGTDQPWEYMPADTRTTLVRRLRARHPQAIVDEFEREHAMKMQAVKVARAAQKRHAESLRQRPGADLVWKT